MKHSVKIVVLLLAMFFVTQLIGLAVLTAYTPEVKQVVDSSGNITNFTDYNLPYGTEPPQDNDPKINLFSMIIALIIAVLLMFFLMHFNAQIVLRGWFFIVISFALGVTLNAILLKAPYSSLIALLIAIPLAFIKVFKRNIIIHNVTELLIYPGIAAIFVPLLNVVTVIVFLIFLSAYDMYAVWHAGFMQKMAKYQIKTLRVFSGFYVPYLGKNEMDKIKRGAKGKLATKNVKVHVAILGGGDVVFPIILAGVVLRTLGIAQAILIAVGATLALAGLFYYSEKGKFYPALPFISAGCFLALIISYII